MATVQPTSVISITMRVSQIILVSLAFFFLVSCQSNTGNNQNKHTSDAACQPYFDFDSVIHYSSNITDEELLKIERKNDKTPGDIKLLKLLIQHTPQTLSDTTILKNIKDLGFAKENISSTKFDELNNIFCERKHAEDFSTTCDIMYRHILVFKKADRTIGTAKICFRCQRSVIAGTKRNTEGFGQSGDYEKLKDLLIQPAQ